MTKFQYTNEQQAQIDAAIRMFEEFAEPPEIRSMVQQPALYAFLDHAVNAARNHELDPHQIAEVEQRTNDARNAYLASSNNGMGVGLYVPGLPGFAATDEEKRRFAAAAAEYNSLPLPDEVRAKYADTKKWVDEFISKWKWRRQNPRTVDMLEHNVSILRNAYWIWIADKAGEAQAKNTSTPSFRVGDLVEFFDLDTWHLAKIEEVVMHEGQLGHYAVSHDKYESPDGEKMVMPGTHPFVLPDRVRSRQVITEYKQGAVVELQENGHWIPAKIDKVHRTNDRISYDVSYDQGKDKDGLTSHGGTYFELSPERLRLPRGDVGWFPGFGPNDASRELFAQASARFDVVMAWGAASKLPHRKPTIEAIEKYRAEWHKGNAPIEHLGGFKADVESLAREAAEKGFVISGGPLPKFDVESASSALKGATATTEATKALADAGKELGSGVGFGLKKFWQSIPTSVKIGGGAGVLLMGGIFAASFGNAKGRR